MPIYNYYCPECGYEDEVYTHMNKRSHIRNCPKCLTILQRKIGIGKIFDLKGEGYYKKGIQ